MRHHSALSIQHENYQYPPDFLPTNALATIRVLQALGDHSQTTDFFRPRQEPLHLYEFTRSSSACATIQLVFGQTYGTILLLVFSYFMNKTDEGCLKLIAADQSTTNTNNSLLEL